MVQRAGGAAGRFDARPHWGKYFHTTPDRLAELHPNLPRFAELARDFDKAGKFANDFVRQHVIR